MSVIKCEMSVITMTLHWHNSQIFNLDNCVDDTPIETGRYCYMLLLGLRLVACPHPAARILAWPRRALETKAASFNSRSRPLSLRCPDPLVFWTEPRKKLAAETDDGNGAARASLRV